MKSKPIQITSVNNELHILCQDGSIWVKRQEFECIYEREKKSATIVKVNIKEEQDKLYAELKQYVGKYSTTMLRAFFNYWSEPNQAGNKMRCQMEKTWDTGKRLVTWSNNNFGSATAVKAEKKETLPKYDPTEADRARELLERSGQLRKI